MTQSHTLENPTAPGAEPIGNRRHADERADLRHCEYPRSIRVLKAVNYAFAHLYHRTRVLAPLRLPDRGRALLIANHISGLDPLLLQTGCPRVIRWMMAVEYYQQPSLHWLFERLDAIPVQRNGRDTAATRTALRALHQGHVLGIFPEGRIETTRQLADFQTGAALLAYRTGTPIYPAYVDGTQRRATMLGAFFHPQQCVIVYGRRIDVPRMDPTRDDLESLSRRLRDAVVDLQRRVQASYYR